MKAILEFDAPNSCRECPLVIDEYCSFLTNKTDTGNVEYHEYDNAKHERCPLKVEIEQLNSLDRVRVAAFIKMTAERDSWKARVDELEQVLKEDRTRSAIDKGIKHDEGKTRYSLMPVFPLEQLAKVYTVGAEKYGKDNWRKGIEYSRIYDAVQRHLNAWWGGEHFDEEDNLPHLAHAAWNLFTLLEYEANKTQYQNFDDRIKESVFE